MRRALLIISGPLPPHEGEPSLSPTPAQNWPRPEQLLRLEALQQTLNEREVAATLPKPATLAALGAWAAADGESASELALGIAVGALVPSPQGPLLKLGADCSIAVEQLFESVRSSARECVVLLEASTAASDRAELQSALLAQATSHGICLLAQLRTGFQVGSWSMTAAFEELLNEQTLRETIAPTGAKLTMGDVLVALRSGQSLGALDELCTCCQSPDSVLVPAMRSQFESESLVGGDLGPAVYASTMASHGAAAAAPASQPWMQQISSSQPKAAPDEAQAKVPAPGSTSISSEVPQAEPAPETLHSLVPPGPPTSSVPPAKPRAQSPQAASQDTLLKEAVEASVAGDSERAVAACLQCLSHYPRSRLTYPDVLNVLTHFARWQEALDAYERLARLQTDRRATAAIFISCSRLAGTKLGNTALAAHYMSRASEARPGVVELQRAAGRLQHAAGNPNDGERHLRAAIKLAPLDPESYRELARQLAIADEEASVRCASVLSALGQATAEEAQLAERHNQSGLPKPSRSLTDEDIRAALAVPSGDEDLGRALELLADAAIKLWRLKPKEQQRLLAHYVEEDSTTSTTTLARALVWSSRLLGKPPPRLFLAVEGRTLAPLPLAKAAWVASRPLGRGPSMRELVFTWTRALVRSVPPFRVLLPCPTELELMQLLDTARVALLQAAGADRLMAERARQLQQALTAEQADEARSVLLRLEPINLANRVKRWHQAATECANRCGLLACGDIGQANSALRFLAPENLDEQLGQVFAFAVDPAYQALRTDLGIELAGEPESEDVIFPSL